MENRKFAVFILTHGRADNVATYNTLRSHGYTGEIYFIIDNLDEQRGKYKANFWNEHVIVFDKEARAAMTDTMDNAGNLRAIIYARNESFKIAKDLGLTHFLQLDDDYTAFHFRYIKRGKLDYKVVEDLDSLFEYFCDCLDETGAATIAMAQGGDFCGGINGTNARKRVLRKAMNTFFCRTDRPIEFKGTMNEDVTSYTLYGSQGRLFFTATEASIVQKQTQATAGGMSELYCSSGAHVKPFYSVMAMPSAVKVSMMQGGRKGHGHFRVHHAVDWEKAVPKIIDEKWKKGERNEHHGEQGTV